MKGKPWQAQPRNEFLILAENPTLDPPTICRRARARQTAQDVAAQLRRKGYRTKVRRP